MFPSNEVVIVVIYVICVHYMFCILVYMIDNICRWLPISRKHPISFWTGRPEKRLLASVLISQSFNVFCLIYNAKHYPNVINDYLVSFHVCNTRKQKKRFALLYICMLWLRKMFWSCLFMFQIILFGQLYIQQQEKAKLVVTKKKLCITNMKLGINK
jgi:hypothetical protein